MKSATSFAMSIAAILCAYPAAGDDVIQMVTHNPPFAFNEEIAKAIEAHPDITLSTAWHPYSQANVWVFFIPNGSEASLSRLPRFAQEIYSQAGSESPAFLKYVYGDPIHDYDNEITVAFFNQSFSADEDIACVAANFVIQLFNDPEIRSPLSASESCTK